MMKALFAVLAICALTSAAYAQLGASALIGAGGTVGSVEVHNTGSTVLTTLTVQNTTATAQAAGPGQTFGWVFKKGDIPTGTAPIFLVNGVVQPYSTGLQTYWNDGSLRFASFLPEWTFSIAANGSQAVTIESGGKWPYTSAAPYSSPTATVSGRTLAELYNQNLVVNMPLAAITANGRCGALGPYSAWLDGDGNQYRVLKWLDGPAGTGWKISVRMATAKGGSPDGMLVFDNYVIALNNGSGGLAGYRWMGDFRQPFYNQAGQTNNSPGKLIVMSPPSTSTPTAGPNFQIQPGGTGPISITPYPWLGNDGATFDSENFYYPGDNSNVLTTGASGAPANNNWFMGSSGGAGYQMLPVVFSNVSATINGSLNFGSNVTTGGYGFIGTNPSNQAQQFLLFQIGGGYDQFSNLATTSFTGTATPVPMLVPYTSMPFATTQGTYFFFRGSGSQASDSTTLNQINQTYWASSGVIPPYALSMVGNATPFTFNYSWFPYQFGPYTQNQPGTGDGPFIGILSDGAALDFDNQTVSTLYLERIEGLYAASAMADVTDAGDDYPPNLGNPSGNYSLPSPTISNLNLNLSLPRNGSSQLFDATQGSTNIGPGLSLGEHEEEYAAWPLLRTGELQYLDFLERQATQSVLANGSGFRTVTPATAETSGTYYGTTQGSTDEMRSFAWQERDRAWAAMLYPHDPTGMPSNPVYTDGSNVGLYLNNLADDEASWPNDQFTNAAAFSASYIQGFGYWTPYYAFNYNVSGPSYEISGGSWEFADKCQAEELDYARNHLAAAGSFIANNCAKYWNSFLNATNPDLGGMWVVYTDGNRLLYNLATEYNGQQAAGLISSNNNLFAATSGATLVWDAIVGSGHPYVTWPTTNTGSTNLFTIHGTFPQNDYSPANGDALSPDPGFGSTWYPSEWTIQQPYYIINLTLNGGSYNGATFQVSTTPGGSPMTMTSTMPSSGYPGSMAFLLRPATTPPLSAIYVMSNIGQIRCAEAWGAALGIAGFGSESTSGTLLYDAAFRLQNTPGTTFFYPGWQLLSAGGPYDVRYAYQPNF